MRFYHGQLEPSPIITSSLTINQPPPYYVGDTITGQFTIKNEGTASITFDVLTIGGRDPDDQVADFTFQYGITLNPGESYKYQGTLNLMKEGNYHFFCSYKIPDGNWNTAIPTKPGISNILDITVNPIIDNPYIDSITPSSGAPGIEVTIKGFNFDAMFSQSVQFGSKSAIIIEWSDTEIIVKVPYGEGIVDVIVSKDFENSNNVKFTFEKPIIDYIDPIYGEPNTEVTISGTNFGEPGLSLLYWVYFGCSNAEEISWNDTEIIAKAPWDYGTGKIDKFILKWILKLALQEAEIVIDEDIMDQIYNILLSCDIEIKPSGGEIKVPVTVTTPAGESNKVFFSYPVSILSEVLLESPGELRVYDSLGRVTGIVNGEPEEEIPNTIYDGNNVILVNPNDSYTYEMVGIEEGEYGIKVNFTENGNTINFAAIDIPTSTKENHQYKINWTTLSQGEEGVIVQVDSNGDGIFDYNFTSDSELTYDEYINATKGFQGGDGSPRGGSGGGGGDDDVSAIPLGNYYLAIIIISIISLIIIKKREFVLKK